FAPRRAIARATARSGRGGGILAISAALVLGGLGIEAALGYPDALFQLAGHPVTWIGALISRLDRALNRATLPPARRRLNGVLALALLLAATAAPAAALQAAAQSWLPRWPALALLSALASTLFAQRSLWTHVRAVADAFDAPAPPARLAAARVAVARIVGRDVAELDEAGVVRAAIESLAENFSDAVVAPALWGLAAGLPGIILYKATNTADSMIGHRTPRHESFGWAAARLDDLINLPASRLAALWIVLAAALHRLCGAPCAPAEAARAVARDARLHRSPNAGWPEAAMAGALGLRLAGPRTYAGVPVEDPWMGQGRAEASPADLRRALALYRTACLMQAGAVAALLLA
ncbi:MAG: adenosylcobinamide-phosphate synthase CbiB, partial [Janthinobacterium lividum]